MTLLGAPSALPAVVAAVLGVLLAGCAASTDEVEQCTEHSVEEGVDVELAREACEASFRS